MTLNTINLVIGFIAGIAIGLLLRGGTPTGRGDNDTAAEWRQPMATRKAAGQ